MTLPSSGTVYLDANLIIYSMEKVTPYWPLLQTLWAACSSRTVELVSSELVVLETLVGPRKAGNTALLHDYETLFGSGDIRICPISTKVIRLAAELRADTGMKTPDAIHAATALVDGCAHFLTNDGGFARASKLQLVLLKDCIP